MPKAMSFDTDAERCISHRRHSFIQGERTGASPPKVRLIEFHDKRASPLREGVPKTKNNLVLEALNIYLDQLGGDAVTPKKIVPDSHLDGKLCSNIAVLQVRECPDPRVAVIKFKIKDVIQVGKTEWIDVYVIYSIDFACFINGKLTCRVGFKAINSARGPDDVRGMKRNHSDIRPDV